MNIEHRSTRDYTDLLSWKRLCCLWLKSLCEFYQRPFLSKQIHADPYPNLFLFILKIMKICVPFFPCQTFITPSLSVQICADPCPNLFLFILKIMKICVPFFPCQAFIPPSPSL